jgi:hypothetical protein
MTRGSRKRGRGGSKASQATKPQSKFFSSNLPEPWDAPGQSGEGQQWNDTYFHPARPSFDCQGCGKIYATIHHLTSHERSCLSSKRGLSALLKTSKVFWESRKRRRLENLEEAPGTRSDEDEPAPMALDNVR